MRIGFDGKRATMNFRGLGNFSRGLIEGLLDYSDNDLFLYTPKAVQPRAVEWLKKNQNEKLHVRYPQTLVEKKLHALWRSLSIAGDINNDKLDLFHGLSHEIPFSSGMIKTKKVVTIHDLIFLRYPEFFPFVDRVTYKAKFKFSCTQSDKVMAICEQTKRDLIDFLNVPEEKILVHYQSCDPVFYDLRSEDEIVILKKKYNLNKPFLLTVGAFEQRKNQLGLIRSFHMVNEKNLDLVLIGAGKDYLKQCRELVSELKLENRVHFLSNISFAELPLFYQAAEVFCFPSFFEGFGLPIVEALFSKTPVITSVGSCFPESGGPTTIYTDPQRPEDMANEIDRLILDPNRMSSMGEEGLKFVQKFHRKDSTLALLDCYRQV